MNSRPVRYCFKNFILLRKDRTLDLPLHGTTLCSKIMSLCVVVQGLGGVAVFSVRNDSGIFHLFFTQKECIKKMFGFNNWILGRDPLKL